MKNQCCTRRTYGSEDIGRGPVEELGQGVVWRGANQVKPLECWTGEAAVAHTHLIPAARISQLRFYESLTWQRTSHNLEEM